MLNLVIWSLVTLVIIGVIVYLVIRTKKRMQPPLCARQAIEKAKRALKDKKQRPRIYRCCNVKKTEDLIVSAELKSMSSDPMGNFRFRWPDLDLKYTLTENIEEVDIQLTGHREIISLLYVEGALGSLAIGADRFDSEHFDMRQSGNIADQLRSFIRHHLKLRGGTLEVERWEEPTFTPVLDVNKPGEIKLKEIPITWGKPKSRPDN